MTTSTASTKTKNRTSLIHLAQSWVKITNWIFLLMWPNFILCIFSALYVYMLTREWINIITVSKCVIISFIRSHSVSDIRVNVNIILNSYTPHISPNQWVGYSPSIPKGSPLYLPPKLGLKRISYPSSILAIVCVTFSRRPAAIDLCPLLLKI